jgi:hypothetical protein
VYKHPVAAAKTSVEAYAAVFDPKVAAHTKSLVIRMVLPFALLPRWYSAGSRVAAGPVYDAKGATRVLQTIVLTVAAMLIFLGYRFVLLLITLHTT